MQTVGRYQILEELGRGAVGVVYRARSPEGKDVAVKVLLDPDPDPRFWQEAQAAGLLHHPGIVEIFEFAHDADGREFMAMEFVEGEALRDQIRREGPLPLERAVDLSLQLCAAIGHAHRRRVIHRDLKPQNVIVTPEGRAKLTDFGMGKVVDQAESLTRTGDVLGTPAYMPPEQALGDKARVGPASDLYSLGATLFVMLTGELPFQALSAADMLRAVLHATPVPPSQLRPQVPTWLDAVCLRCLEKEPGQRYKSAAALAKALRAGGAPRRTTRRARAAATLVVLVGAALAAGVGAARWDPAPDARAEKARARGERLCEADDWRGGLAALTQAIELDPDFVQAYRDRADALANLDRSDDALADLNRALELEPDHAETLCSRAAVLLEQEELERAREDLERALELDPGDPDAHMQLGLCRHYSGDDAAAVVAYSSAIELKPDYKEAYTNRAASLHGLGELEQALRDLDHALGLDAENSVASYNRGVVRWQSGDEQGALEDMHRTLELDPSSSGAHDMIGQFLYMQGDYEAALASFKRALALVPDEDLEPELQGLAEACQDRLDAPRHVARAEALAAAGKLEQAVDTYTKALYANPTETGVFQARGVLLQRLGYHEQALKDLRRAIELEPSPGVAHAYAVLAAQQLGDDQAIVDLAPGALEANLDDPWPQRMREIVDEARTRLGH